MATINNTGTIYNVLEKTGNYMRDDIKTLSDISSMISGDIHANFSNKKEVKEHIAKNRDILKEIESMAQSLVEVDNLYNQEISENGEANIVLALLTMLNIYGMLDISYSNKGKITIDLSIVRR